MRKINFQLTLVYYSFFLLVILAALLGYFLLKNGYSIDSQSPNGIALLSFLYLVILAPVPVSLSLFNKACKKLATVPDEDKKLRTYRKYSILRITAIGIGLLLGVVFFYVMNKQSLLFCAGISAVALFFCKPSESKISSDTANCEEDTEDDTALKDNKL